jgi:hypothetical protein
LNLGKYEGAKEGYTKNNGNDEKKIKRRAS